MRFIYGAEIELPYGVYDPKIHRDPDYLNGQVIKGWDAKGDGSISNERKKRSIEHYALSEHGREYVMRKPVLASTFERMMLDSEAWAKRDINQSCGLHVHLGLRDDDGKLLHLSELVSVSPKLQAAFIEADALQCDVVSRHDPSRLDRYCQPNNGVVIRRSSYGSGDRYGRNSQHRWLLTQPQEIQRSDIYINSLRSGSCSTVLSHHGSIEFRRMSPKIKRSVVVKLMKDITRIMQPAVNETLRNYTTEKVQ